MLSVGGLFDGAGLLALGLHQAGLRHAWLCESDPWRRGILERRFPGVPVLDDVRAVDSDAVRRVDVIAGGFPCKGASTAGKREGFGHPETVLWREMARAVRELRPRYVLVENVSAILALHDGAVWGEVLGSLAACGYDVEWDVLPAAAVGAPHLRERVFAVAAYAEGAGGQGACGDRAALGGVAADDRGAPADADGAGREELHGAAEPDRPQHPRAAVTGDQPSADATSGCARRDSAYAPRGLVAESRGDHPSAADAGGERRQQVVRSAHGDEGADARRRADDDHQPPSAREGWVPAAVEWGVYEPAIRRWEAVHGPAPEPLVRRLDDGDPAVQRMRARVDRSRLSALGDGVCVHIGRIAGERIIELERRRVRAAA